MDDWGWPYGGAYAIYREDVEYANIESLSLWYNNLPAGSPVTCYLSPIKALRVTFNITLKNRRSRWRKQHHPFPVGSRPGPTSEFRGMTDCKLYGPNGEVCWM